MSAVDHAAMRAAAEGATAAGFMYDDDYIAAAYPAAVLALLDEVQRLREAGLKILDAREILTDLPDDSDMALAMRLVEEAIAVFRAAREPRT